MYIHAYMQRINLAVAREWRCTANFKRVETNAKEEAQQGGRGLNGKAVPP